MEKSREGESKKLVVGVTVGTSAMSLLRGQLAWFSEHGWEVYLVCSPDEAAKSAALREDVQLFGIPMRREISPYLDFKALLKWIRFMKRELPDAINVGTPKAGLLGVLAGTLLRVKKRVYTVRGLRLEGVKFPLSTLLWLMEALTMSLATDVIFVSKSLAVEAGARRLVRGRKSWVIGSGSSNGVQAIAVADRAQFMSRLGIRQKLQFEPGEFVVGFIGRITAAKGVDTLIEALQDPRLNSRVRCLMIGSIEDSRLGNELDQLGDSIRVVPWTDDVWGHLAAIDVLCLPTNREGFPNAVLEAASAGVPAITTRATGAIDSVIDGMTGLLIDIGDADALTLCINRLEADPVLTRRLGVAAKVRAFEHFKPEDVWRGIFEVLRADEHPLHARRFFSRDDGRQRRRSRSA